MKIVKKNETEKLIFEQNKNGDSKSSVIKNKRLLIILILIVVICVAAVLVSYCIKSGAGAANNAENGDYRGFDKISEEQFNNGNLNICMITKGYGSGYWDTLIQGAIDSAEERNVNLYLAGIAKESNTDKLAELMEEALEMHPDAIIVSPADTSRINQIVDKINEQDIPLIFVDTILNGQKFDICYMTDNMQAGRMAARDMLIKLKDAGYSEDDTISIGMNIGSRQSQTIIERLAGVYEYWSNNAPTKWKIIDSIKCNNGSIDIAYEQCLEFFEENENLAGLIGLNNGSTVGLCRGLSEKKRTDIVLVGFDYSDDIAALIADGEYHVSTLVQRQYNMGYGSVDSAVDICSGNEPQCKYYNTGISRVDHNNYSSPYINQKVLMK